MTRVFDRQAPRVERGPCGPVGVSQM